RPRDGGIRLQQPSDGHDAVVAARVNHVVGGPLVAPDLTGSDRRRAQARHHWRLEWTIDDADIDAHLRRQRPAADVVGTVDRRRRRLSTTGIILTLEKCLHVGAVWLRQEDYISAGWIEVNARAKRLDGPVNFDAALEQEL